MLMLPVLLYTAGTLGCCCEVIFLGVPPPRLQWLLLWCMTYHQSPWSATTGFATPDDMATTLLLAPLDDPHLLLLL